MKQNCALVHSEIDPIGHSILSEIFKQLAQLNIKKKSNNLIEKWIDRRSEETLFWKGHA